MTTDSPTKELSLKQKLDLLQHFIQEGQKLALRKLSPPQPAAPGDNRTPLERWKDETADALLVVGAPVAWISVLRAAGPGLATIAIAVEDLRALRGRLQRRESLVLDDDDARALLTLRSTLLIWGDHAIDLSSGSRPEGGYYIADHQAFISSLPELLKSALAHLQNSRSVSEVDLRTTVALVDGRLDADSFTPGANSEVWHAGWALFTLAWWLADSVGDPLTIAYGQTCASFAEAKSSRAQFLSQGGVNCPRCGARVDAKRGNERTRVALPSGSWMCSSCNITGYFPVSVPAKSAWTSPGGQRAEPLDRDEVEVVGPELATPDLSWMRDAVLRRIAGDDFDEVNVCLQYGAYKAALLLAGSICETMLLDMLERNAVVAKTYLRKPDDFPDRVSLEQLVDAAMGEGLVTHTALHLAPAVKNYRDLIHPHRVRMGNIKVDVHTAKLLAQAAVIIGRDLRDADLDGRAASFEKKS